MSTEYCGFVSTNEDRQECLAAVEYIEAVIEHDCAAGESEFCESYNEMGDFTYFFESLPPDIQNDVSETFVNAFGFVRDDVPGAFNSVALGNGLPPHQIFCGEFSETRLPATWGLEGAPFELGGSEADATYRPTGWATLVDVSLDGLAFRESDGIDARVGTRFSAAYYFDLGFFVSGGFEFTTTFAEDGGVFNFDLAIEGGYYLSVLDHLGFEFFASLNLGYLMSDGSGLSSFDAGIGGGLRIMIPLLDDPVKSNLPSLFIGADYSRRLNSPLPPDQFFLSLGTLFNFI